jgi:hypothetical protein
MQNLKRKKTDYQAKTLEEAFGFSDELVKQLKNEETQAYLETESTSAQLDLIVEKEDEIDRLVYKCFLAGLRGCMLTLKASDGVLRINGDPEKESWDFIIEEEAAGLRPKKPDGSKEKSMKDVFSAISGIIERIEKHQEGADNIQRAFDEGNADLLPEEIPNNLKELARRIFEKRKNKETEKE